MEVWLLWHKKYMRCTEENIHVHIAAVGVKRTCCFTTEWVCDSKVHSQFWLAIHWRVWILLYSPMRRDGAVEIALASYQYGPGSIPGLGVTCGLSLLLVLVPGPRGFSPGTPVFPSSQKPTFPNSNSIWIIVKLFIMSFWLGRLRKYSPC